jgi:O-antigen/teichoic acid export membrane protein
MAARVFGDGLYGELSIVLAIVYLFENLVDLGLSEITLRDVSRNNESASKYISNLITWKSILCCAVFLLIFSICQFLPYSGDVLKAIYIFALSAFFKSFKYTFLAFFKAANRYGLESVSVTMERALILLFGVIILTFSPTLINLMWVFLGVRLVDLIITFYILNKTVVKTTLTFDFQFIKILQLNALPLGIYVYIAFVYGYIDTIMLSFFKSAAEIGWYNAAYRIYDGLIMLPFILHYTFFPPLSRYFGENKDKHSVLSSDIAQYSCIFVLPFCALLAYQANFIINTLFGNAFEQAVPAFKILMMGLFFTFLIVIFNCILISMDKLKPILYFAVLGLILNVISNLILIPKLGYLGAAVSTTFSEIVVFIITMMYLDTICERLRLRNKIIKFSIVAFIIVTLVLLCMKLGISIAFLISISAIAYAICLILLKLIDLRKAGSIIRMLISFRS